MCIRDRIRPYYREAGRVARTLVRAFADALHLPPKFFEAYNSHSLDVLRMNNYALPAGTDVTLDGDLTGMGEHTDYGIVTGRVKPCVIAQPAPDTWTFTSGDSTLELAGSPLAFRLLWKGQPVTGSITDRHFRGVTRLPAFGRVRAAPHWIASLALASGEPVYGLGEKFGSLDKRGQLVHSQVEDCLGVNTGCSYKNTPFAWSPGTGRGAWGLFVNTPARVTHGVGHPDWSHRSYAVVVDDEALDLFLFAAAAPAGIVDLYTQLTGRAPLVPRWSLGLWISRMDYKTPGEAAEAAAKMRSRKIPCDVIALDGRTTWKTDTRFNFQWDAERFPDPRAAIAAIKAHRLRVCVWEYPCVSVHDPLFAELAQRHYLLTTDLGDPYVYHWDCLLYTSPSPRDS